MLLHSDKSISISKTTGDGREDTGLGTITFETMSRCIGLRLPPTPVKWLATQRCGDAVVFEFTAGQTILHLIEMKSAMRPSEWIKTKQQLAGAYHNALALAGVLHLNPPFEIRVHVAYRDDRLTGRSSADGTILKQRLGGPATETFHDWTEGRIGIDGIANIPLNKIRRDENGDATAGLT